MSRNRRSACRKAKRDREDEVISLHEIDLELVHVATRRYLDAMVKIFESLEAPPPLALVAVQTYLYIADKRNDVSDDAVAQEVERLWALQVEKMRAAEQSK